MMQSLPRTAAAVSVYALVALIAAGAAAAGGGEQPLSRIAIHRATVEPQPGAFVDASPALLGLEVSLLEQLLLYRRLSAHRSAAAVTSSWLLSLRCSKPPTSKLIRIGVHRRLRFLSQPRLKFCNSLAIYVSITPMSKLNQDLQRRYHIGPL
jgi:hypothetical protein